LINTKTARNIAKNVGILLKPLFGNKKCDMNKMIEVLKNYSKNTENQLQTPVTEVEEEITESIRDCNLDEINYVLKLASSFGTFKQDTNFLNRLEACYSQICNPSSIIAESVRLKISQLQFI
jgi:hypothetical protein